MKASSPRWHEVTESPYPHEREALAYVRELLPDRAPWEAWSNFTFVAADGRHRECDLLVSGPDGVHLVEIKNWKGHLSNDGRFWSRGGRPVKNPLDLTVTKAKELQEYLDHEARLVDTTLKPPFVQASLFMAEPTMRCSLDRYAGQHVYAPDHAANALPRLGADLLFSRSPFRTPTSRFHELLPDLLSTIGIASGPPSRTVGAWTIERDPYDEGPTWQDFHATRTDITWNPHRRIRIYLEAKRSDEDVRRSIRAAAEREFQVAAGVHHPGILAPSDFEEHELGPALIIEQDRSAERLDHWLARHREKVTTKERVGLLGQLASAVAYAHRRGLVHRALSPRAVIVESGRLRVGEWQVSTRDMASRRSRNRAAPTSMAAGHLDPAVEPFLAPEFVTEGVDGTVDVDIFGVGAIAYLLLTGDSPAASRPELKQRVIEEGCLDPKSGDDALDAIVRDATRPSLSERTSSVDDIVTALRIAARPTPPEPKHPKTPTPTPPPAKDPLDATAGDVLAGGYRVEKVLGRGSTARAFLVRRDGSQNVLKIGLNADSERLLAAEAAALEDLRHDHVVVLRRASFAVADRRAIELSNAGDRTLTDVITSDGPLRGVRLRVAGDQLLSAVEYLAERDVLHRDIKPSNIGIRTDRDPFRLALFDFSLAATPPDDVLAGTPGYLDPHLGVGDRTVYDGAAEQYAVAATLHELASGTTPRWGDDGTAAAVVPEVTLDDAAFDPAIRGALATFLRRGLAKAASDRFGSPVEMRAAWNALFATPPSTVHPQVVRALDVHVDVVNQLRRLDAEARDRTIDALERASHPEPRLEAPVGARDDRMRLMPADEVTGVILLEEGAERGLLVRLDAPEAAAVWARAHAASVNGISGELELRDAVALDQLADVFRITDTDVDLYGHVTDEQFGRLGVDERVADWARTVPDVGELERAQALLPPQQYAVLLSLARGVPVDDLIRGPVGPTPTDEPVDPDDLGAAVGRSAGQIAMLEDLEELRQLLGRPISHFATFLHPSQRKLAYKPNWGSTQVTGGPGTGKTVVALHRVKYLVGRAELGPEKVLLTTFTKGLAEALERDLRQMIDADRMAAVTVVNIDRWAYGLVRERLGRIAMLDDKDADARWRRAAEAAGAPQSPAFLDAEWEQVVLAQQIAGESEYLACERRGRGKPLPASQRSAVWQAIETFAESLRADGKWTYMTIADEAARLLAAEEPPYEHVVVDEIQDLHPAHWRLLRAAVKPKPEDLFLTGDPHQRIYGHRVSLKTVGINIGGRRSTKLSLSYRTSAEILAWSMRMLGNHHETGLDDVADDLASYRSAFSGQAPEVVGASTRDEEMAELVDAVRQWHDDGIDWEDIAVVGRGQHVWRSAASALRKADVPVIELRKAAGESAVRVGTMHGLKGLEFRAVAVVGVSEGVIPRAGITPPENDEVVHRNEMQDERNLLFVAATRPRERLRVSWHGTPSAFLPPA